MNFISSFNKHFAPLLVSVFALCVLCGEALAQHFKQTHPGVEHAQVDHEIGSDPVKINLLRLDLNKVRLDVHKANDRAIGLEATSSISQRKSAVAAINGGFFRLDKSEWAGDAAGLLMIDGELLSEGIPGRLSLWISGPTGTPGSRIMSDKQDVAFNRLLLRWRVRVGTEIKFLSGVNRERKGNELVIYTPEFGQTTLTDDSGSEIIVENGRIIKTSPRKGNNKIPRNGYVLSGSGGFVDELLKFRVGIKVDSGIQFFNPESTANLYGNTKFPSYDIVGGVPQLIKDGKIDITWEQEKAGKAFVFNRHPRTAVAKMKDGKFLMVTVDGRQPGVSVGMTLPELAEYLHSLGAVDAMNLNGGGATTMVLDGKVVNKPSDPTGERKVGDAIVVTLRK